MSQEVVLYDLPSKGQCQSFSPFVWRIRLALSLKKIPYKTEFVPFTRLQEVLATTGVKTEARYTVPTVKLPDGTAVMDSLPIAEKLEQLHPTPSLHLDTGLHVTAMETIGQIVPGLRGNLFPRVARDVIVPEDVEWFKESRRERLGMTLDEMEALHGGDAGWEAAKPGFKAMAEVLTKNKKDEGPFILGSTVSYGDFVIVGLMQMFKVVGQDMFDRFCAQDPAFGKLYEACGQWLEKTD